MKQRPRYLVGIDIAADTFAATALTSPGHPVFLREELANTPEGFSELCVALETHDISVDQVVVVVEATGVYAEPWCYFLEAKGYEVAVEPPNQVKKAFQSRRKTDPIDSRQIAEYGYRYFDKLHFWKPKAELLEQIRSVLTTRELLTKQLTAHRNALEALERKVVKTPVAIRMHQKSIRRGVKDIQALDQAIKEFIDQDPELKAKAALAQSVPGGGQLLTANLMVITEGFTQHMNPKSLAAYAGICPYEHQSGSSVKKKPRSDRHGTGRIRKLLHLAARSVATHKLSFRRYFLRKVEQGKPKRLALNNIANQLLKIICAVVTSNTPYIEGYRSINPALLR